MNEEITQFRCRSCRHVWTAPKGTYRARERGDDRYKAPETKERPPCPACGSGETILRDGRPPGSTLAYLARYEPERAKRELTAAVRKCGGRRGAAEMFGISFNGLRFVERMLGVRVSRLTRSRFRLAPLPEGR